MWSSDPSVQKKCRGKIRAVCALDDASARYELAVREIVDVSVYASEWKIDFISWACTMGLAAIYPRQVGQLRQMDTEKGERSGSAEAEDVES